jgi:epoxyqueuosine reductase
MDESQFAERFRGSALKRAKWRGLVRNALIVAGNKGDSVLRPLIERYCQHEDPILRETAHWALAQLTAHAEDNGCLTKNHDA